MQSSAKRGTSGSPSVATAMIGDLRARASWTLDKVFSKMRSRGSRATTGIVSSSMAMGPCFISPAECASAWT